MIIGALSFKLYDCVADDDLIHFFKSGLEFAGFPLTLSGKLRFNMCIIHKAKCGTHRFLPDIYFFSPLLFAKY